MIQYLATSSEVEKGVPTKTSLLNYLNSLCWRERNYTETDIKEAVRVSTGYNADRAQF